MHLYNFPFFIAPAVGSAIDYYLNRFQCPGFVGCLLVVSAGWVLARFASKCWVSAASRLCNMFLARFVERCVPGCVYCEAPALATYAAFCLFS